MKRDVTPAEGAVKLYTFLFNVTICSALCAQSVNADYKHAAAASERSARERKKKRELNLFY